MPRAPRYGSKGAWHICVLKGMPGARAAFGRGRARRGEDESRIPSSWEASYACERRQGPHERKSRPGQGVEAMAAENCCNATVRLKYSFSMRSKAVATSKRVQYAALPYRRTGAADPEVMLVTSRGRQRWIIPKGWPHGGRAPCDSAAREAFEEAGILGEVGRRSGGHFVTRNGSRKGRVAVCNVHVFPLNVARQRPQWPEKNQRDIKWVSVKEAAEAVQNARLSAIILRWAQIAAAPKRRARRLLAKRRLDTRD